MNSCKRIAIHKHDKTYVHSTGWTEPWIAYCENHNLKYEVVNCYDANIIEKLKNFDYLLWHFSNIKLQDMLFARSILYSAKKMGLKVFPDFNTAWHFDDKISETYLLKSVDAPQPKSWVFYSRDECMSWLKIEAHYPLVAKLRSGSGSYNVKLLDSQAQATRYAKKMFKKGYRNVPNILFKVKTNVRSVTDRTAFISKFKRIPEFMRTLSHAKLLPRERGYVYLQEFVPNDGYDIKIVVVGNKLSYFGRKARYNDYRASGGGLLFYDKSVVTPDIIKTAYEISGKLGFQCMGYDYVIDTRTKECKIVEVSFGFAHNFVLQAGGYWDRSGIWHEEPLNAPEEVISNLINSE
jgi:glutathione synthase/RimK-type ligase-like ATP-grasp enzyme